MAVLVNNLGALSAIEVLVMSNEILSQLQRKGVTVVRAYVGAFMTALEVRLHPTQFNGRIFTFNFLRFR